MHLGDEEGIGVYTGWEKGHLPGSESLLFKADPSPELLTHTIYTSFIQNNVLIMYSVLCSVLHTKVNKLQSWSSDI